MAKEKNHKNDTDDISTEVADAVVQFVEHLHARGPALDLDRLSDEVRSAVEQLLPAVAEAVLTGDGAPTTDVPDWQTSSVAAALGFVPAGGKRRVSGAAVRAARTAGGLSEAELARAISERGHTVTTSFVKDIEGQPGFAVESRLVDVIADALDVTPETLTLTDEDGTTDPLSSAGVFLPHDESAASATRLIDEILFALADVEVSQAPLTVTGRGQPLVALKVARLGLDTWVALFDVIDQRSLWGPDILGAAERIFAIEPDTVVVFCVASDDEHSTQPLDLSDLKGALVAPSGQRLRHPRRPILPLGDSVRAIFEELLPVWDDIDLPSSFSMASSIAPLVERIAAARLTALASSPRVQLEAKKAGLAIVSRRKPQLVARIGRLADEIRREELDDNEFIKRLFAPLVEAS